MKSSPLGFLASLAFLALAPSFARADWPSYLHDATRVGATAEPLAAPLHTAWSYTSPVAPATAWSGEGGRVFEGYEMTNRVRFDEVFHTVIAAGRVYFGSSVDGRIYCRDLASGREVWAAFTDGPIRLAPQIAEGKLFVGSDDGYAYCFEAATGKLLWKLRAGPNDERILARGRMISRWPVRTGVLVDGGTAYFGAGVFPHENVYLYAVEAATGKIVWKNDAISQGDAGRNDLSPQGYLLATKDILFVPSGRALSVACNRHTGELLEQKQGAWRGIGGTQALLADDQIYAVGEHQILATEQETGKAGFGWFRGNQLTLAGDIGYMTTGSEVLAIDRVRHGESTRKLHTLETEKISLEKDLKKHPALAELKNVQAAEAALKVATGDGLQKAQEAFAAAGKKYEPARVDYQKKKDRLAAVTQLMKDSPEAGVKWRFKTPHDSALILAGETVIVGGDGEVVALDVKTGAPVWKSAVEGDARGLSSAAGHLMVSTSTGKIYAFADSAQPAVPEVATAASGEPFPKDELSEKYASAADAILQQTSIKRGFCLVLGSEQGRLAYELAKRSELTVCGIEADERKVQSSREALVKTGLYGSRVTIDHFDLGVLPYSSYFANLIVSDTSLLGGEVPGLPAEVARNLKPVGGTICLPEKAAAWFAGTRLGDEGAKITTEGAWTRLVRGKLPGADSWSHQYGNAANTSSNSDTRIKGGMGVLWYGDPGPSKMVNRHDGAVGPVSVNGRLFVQGTDSVMAYDAYNGAFLWEVKNPGALRTGVYNAREPGNMAASDDHLFMLVGDSCLQFDAATGKVVRTLRIPGAGKANREWGYIAYQDGLLYGTATERVENAETAARRGKTASISTDAIFAYDTKTGALKWTHQGQHISHVSIAIGDGSVFFIDSSLTAAQREELLRQDKSELAKLTGKERENAEARAKKVDLRMAVALDAVTGKQQWAQPVDVTDCSEIGIGGGALTMMYHNGHLVLGGANANGHYWEQFLKGEFARRRLVVLSGRTGEKIWAKDANYRHRPVIIDNQIIAEPWSYDLYSGAQKMRTHPLTGEQSPWMFARPGHHCGAISATPNMMFFRSKSTAFYNLAQDEGTEHFAGQRLGCWINTIPANGLVMIPEASAGCVCLFSIASTVVFEPREERKQWGVYSAQGASTPVQHMALNLGAPGDRRDAHGKLWLSYPRPTSRAGIDLPLKLGETFTPGGGFYSFNADSYKVENTDTPWVHASGARGLRGVKIPLIGPGEKPETYTVRLYFTALESDQPGQRVFDIRLQDKVVERGFDLVKKTGGAKRALVVEYPGVAVSKELAMELAAANGETDAARLPLISGIEVVRTGGAEIREAIAVR